MKTTEPRHKRDNHGHKHNTKINHIGPTDAETGAILGSIIGGGIGISLKNSDSLKIGIGAGFGAGVGAGVGKAAETLTRGRKPMGAIKRGAIMGALTVATPMAVGAVGIQNPIRVGIGAGVGAGIGAGVGAATDKFTRWKREKRRPQTPALSID